MCSHTTAAVMLSAAATFFSYSDDCLAATAGRQDPFVGADPVMVWHSSDDVERSSGLPITRPGECMQFRTVYSVHLPPLKVGDLVEAHADFEITNPYSYVAMFGHFIVLGNNPDDIKGVRIGPAATRNMVPGVHHDDFEQSASYVEKKDEKGKYVNVVAYSSSMLSPDKNQLAKIERGYGMLSVDVIRGSVISNEMKSNPGVTRKIGDCVVDIGVKGRALF